MTRVCQVLARNIYVRVLLVRESVTSRVVSIFRRCWSWKWAISWWCMTHSFFLAMQINLNIFISFCVIMIAWTIITAIDITHVKCTYVNIFVREHILLPWSHAVVTGAFSCWIEELVNLILVRNWSWGNLKLFSVDELLLPSKCLLVLVKCFWKASRSRGRRAKWIVGLVVEDSLLGNLAGLVEGLTEDVLVKHLKSCGLFCG